MITFFGKQQDPKDFNKLLSDFKKLKKEFGEISKELEELKTQSKFSIQKMGIVRFNPFKEIGGNQSFSVALLDANNDGVVITSFYGKDGNRIFGKPINNGRSKFSLASEEKKAIDKAKAINSQESDGEKENKK